MRKYAKFWVFPLMTLLMFLFLIRGCGGGTVNTVTQGDEVVAQVEATNKRLVAANKEFAKLLEEQEGLIKKAEKTKDANEKNDEKKPEPAIKDVPIRNIEKGGKSGPSKVASLPASTAKKTDKQLKDEAKEKAQEELILLKEKLVAIDAKLLYLWEKINRLGKEIAQYPVRPLKVGDKDGEAALKANQEKRKPLEDERKEALGLVESLRIERFAIATEAELLIRQLARKK
jgi:hypothetical protein